MSVDYDAAWAAWDTPEHQACTGFRYDPAAGTVQCADCRAVVAVPEVAEAPGGAGRTRTALPRPVTT